MAPILPESAATTDESIDVVALVEQLCARDAKQRSQALVTLTSDNRINADEMMTARVVPPLLELLRTGNENERGIATSLLLQLAKERDDACRTIANANVLALLLSFAEDADESLSTDATELVVLVAQLDDRYRTALFNANAAPKLAQLRFRGTDAQRSVATRALQELVKGGDAIRRGMLGLWAPAIRDGEGEEKELAMAAVTVITTEDAPVCRFFMAADMTPLLVGMLSTGIESEKTFAAKVLCFDGASVRNPRSTTSQRDPRDRQAALLAHCEGVESQRPGNSPWFVPHLDLDYDPKPFARGSYGALHRGTWRSGTPVVVKTLLIDENDGNAEVAKAQFLHEIELRHKLSHPNVIEMFGACHVTSPPFIVCEDATYVAAFLTDYGSGCLWGLLHDAALGPEYLHANHIVHGDLKLTNLLVGSDGVVHVADFGLSFAVSQTSKMPKETMAVSDGSHLSV